MKLLNIKKSRGFTITEMLIVVVILGIIAGIAIPALFGSVADARSKKIEAALRQVEQAKTHYYLDTKNAGEPPLETTIAADGTKVLGLADYIRDEGSRTGGAEMFYTKEGWAATGQAATGKEGALLDGIKGSYRIKPNGHGVYPELVGAP